MGPIKIFLGEESITEHDEEGKPTSIIVRRDYKPLHKALGHELGHVAHYRKYSRLALPRFKKVKVDDIEMYEMDEVVALRDTLKEELWTEDWTIKKQRDRWTPQHLALFIISCADEYDATTRATWKFARPIAVKLGTSPHIISQALATIRTRYER